MNVTKRQIQNGLFHYIQEDVVKAIPDKPVMMAAAVLASMLKTNDAAVDRVLEHPLVGILLARNADGAYNLDGLFQAIQDTINTYGKLEIKLPLLRAPFAFDGQDFARLKSYIEEGT